MTDSERDALMAKLQQSSADAKAMTPEQAREILVKEGHIMTDIPEDVMKAATEAVCTAYDEGEAIMTVARAILAERENRRPIMFIRPKGNTFAEMAEHARASDLYRVGDMTLVWVNEGDFWQSLPVDMSPAA